MEQAKPGHWHLYVKLSLAVRYAVRGVKSPGIGINMIELP